MTQAGPLHQEHPVEYPEGTAPLSEDEAQALDAHLDQGWQRVGSAGNSPSATSGMPSASPPGSRCSPNGSSTTPS